MAFHVLATNLAQANSGYEPQRQHNWNLEIELSKFGSGVPGDVISLSLASGFLPRGSNEEVPIPYGNEYVYVAGKATWDAGTVVVRDWIDMPVARAIAAWRNAVYNPSNGQIGLARNYKINADVVLFGPNSYDGGSETFERVWKLVGCWPIAANFAANGLDMASSNQVMIELNMRYDKALAQNNMNAGNVSLAPNVPLGSQHRG